ncbi:hypothetical protein HYFRA_00013011 [Hymenoscyphus fraxineus]|uniref:2'-phosphotransferase n=1 Tax=Hymenoscyphus fraxineus TaxID=746836 RepID=A0A9N9L6U1_9HELO|nr:hypothetical protein HYFRA_00013011 [Hymenoscyphus fraxineus]
MASGVAEDTGGFPEGMDVDERFHANARGGRAPRGTGRGRGRGGRGGGGRMNREMEVSKALSKLLRHHAEEAGVKLDNEGFARLDQVLTWSRLKSLQVTFPEILTAVNDNAKNRFSMKPNPTLSPPPEATSTEPSDWVIRANQGHSIAINSEALLKPITLTSENIPEIVIHGTYFAFYQAILESGGLKKMGRTHIHFSTGLPDDEVKVISGMRGDAELLIYIDIKKSLEDGKTLWWISENGVVLTEGDENGVLSTKYWKKVVGRREAECGVLWQDGERLQDLPEGLKNRKAPFGKGHLPKSRGHRERGRGKGRGRGGRGRGRGAGDHNPPSTEGVANP